MGKAATAAGCLKEAEECLGLALATSDPNLKEVYLKIAGDLTRLAAILDKTPNGEPAPHVSEPMEDPKRAVSGVKRQS